MGTVALHGLGFDGMGGSLGWGAEPPATRPCIPKRCQERLASGAGGRGPSPLDGLASGAGGREPPPSCIPSGCTALHPVQGGGNLPQPLREARDARVVGGSAPHPIEPQPLREARDARVRWPPLPCIPCIRCRGGGTSPNPLGGKGCMG